ncbi:MAG: helix-turn-helix domain-containing protein, partial [Pseudomonadota bacterium]|nr:helix-turn-helix domain-containing protein [Pseudomonadota bacterium]
RLNDLPLLLDHFMRQACDELQKDYLAIPTNLALQLQHYPFPGNVRELRALVYDAVSQSSQDELNVSVFQTLVGGNQVDVFERSVRFPEDQPLPTLTQLSKLLVEEAMNRANQNQSLAARMLGISQPALSKRLKNMKEDSED